jgi:hypothetical protein
VTIFDMSRLSFLLRAAEEAANQIDIRAYESDLAAVLDYIQLNIEHRAEISSTIVASIESPRPNAFEVIEYCMHELKWAEVQSAAISFLDSSPDERTRYAVNRLLEAFSEDWDAKAAYARYSTV